MLITVVGEYQATIKTHDKGENYIRESFISAVSLWWKGVDVEKGGWVLVSKGVTGDGEVGAGDGLGEEVSKGAQTWSKNYGIAVKGALVELNKKSHANAPIRRRQSNNY